MPVAEPPACVFCGEPIDPGEESAGRAPMAAHAACADAALADDEHWEAVSRASSGEDDPSVLDRSSRTGCLVAGGVLLLIVLLAATLAMAAAPGL